MSAASFFNTGALPVFGGGCGGNGGGAGAGGGGGGYNLNQPGTVGGSGIVIVRYTI